MVLVKHLLLLMLVGIFFVSGCNSMKIVNDYKYYDVGIDDLPPAKDIEAILIMDYYHPELAEIMSAAGNQDRIEEIIGREIFPDKLENDPMLLNRLITIFKNTERIDRGYLSDARVAFVTKKRAYMIKLAIDDKVVYGPDYESEELKKIFDELGID